MRAARSRFINILIFELALPLSASVIPVLPHPNANELAGPVFVQTFAGLNITSSSDSIGTTEPFFDIAAGAIPGMSVNILGNFHAFDPFGNSTSFDIFGVHVKQGASTFTPPFGSFNFAGHPSLTFKDSLTSETVTFNAGDPTLTFTVACGQFQFTINTNLPLDSSITFQIVDTGVPEPGTFVLFCAGIAVLVLADFQRRRCRGHRSHEETPDRA